MSTLLNTGTSKTLNLDISAPTSNNDHEALFFINGLLRCKEYEVACPVGIKFTRKQLADRPKLAALLGTLDISVLDKFTFTTKVVSGESYKSIQFEESLKLVDDPIIKSLVDSTSGDEPEYFQMIKVFLVMETKAGTQLKCYPPSFEIPQLRVTPTVLAQHALHHHNFVGDDKEVEFIPTGIVSAIKADAPAEEEDY